MTLRNKLMTFASNMAYGVSEITDNVFHYVRPPKQTAPFIVWAEDAEEGSFGAGNKKAEQIIHGVVDLYTKTEFDPLCDAIQNAFLALDGCGWDLRAVQYEQDTNLIHYTWQWWW